MTTFLALETSCDETAAAVFTDDLTVLSSVVASQTDLHARFGGVVPEIASRAHLRNLLPVIDEALRRAGIDGSGLLNQRIERALRASPSQRLSAMHQAVLAAACVGAILVAVACRPSAASFDDGWHQVTWFSVLRYWERRLATMTMDEDFLLFRAALWQRA